MTHMGLATLNQQHMSGATFVKARSRIPAVGFSSPVELAGDRSILEDIQSTDLRYELPQI